MDINQLLLELTVRKTPADPYGTDLTYEYGSSRREIEGFLIGRMPFDNRQQRAIEIIEGIMTLHGKQRLLQQVALLAQVERGIRALQPYVRDHVVHALLSFLLGILLNEDYLQHPQTLLDFKWRLAGLLHDVAYPMEVAANIAEPFTRGINDIKRQLGVNAPDIHANIDLKALSTLQNGVNGFRLIQARLDQWELDIDAACEYESSVRSGKACHGMLGALAILYVIDLMYQKYNPKRELRPIYLEDNTDWNQQHFEDDVVTACSAIFLHNLPPHCFAGAKITRTRAPLAFLLKLSDCLQEWERPKHDHPNGWPSDRFDIEVNAGGVKLYAAIDEARKSKMRQDIAGCLDAPDVQII
ncbi:MAG: hypothetical protein WC712_01895 [Candidatus Brocadiia bacterium]